MERKRFVNYEENDAFQKAADKEDSDFKGPTKEIKDGKIVESQPTGGVDTFEEEIVVGGKGRGKKAEAVRSAPPKKSTDKEAKSQDTKPEDSKADPSKNTNTKETKKQKEDEFDLDGYSDAWGDGSSDEGKPATGTKTTTTLNNNVVVQSSIMAQPPSMAQPSLMAQAPVAAQQPGSTFPPKLDMGMNSQVAQGASEDKVGNDDNYSDDKWDVDDDFDNNKQKQNGQPQNNLNALNFHQEKEQNHNFYGFANDKQGSPSDDGKLFDNEFEDLEKEFNQNQQNDGKLDN